MRVVVLVGLCSLACGGGGANVAACERFVAHFNGLPCNGVRVDESSRVGVPDPICWSRMDDSVDLQPYFTCLEEGLRCDGELLRVDVGSCRPPDP